MAEITKERWVLFNEREKCLHICSEISRAYHYESTNKERSKMFLERALYLLDMTLSTGTQEVYKYIYMHERVAEVYIGIVPSI